MLLWYFDDSKQQYNLAPTEALHSFPSITPKQSQKLFAVQSLGWAGSQSVYKFTFLEICCFRQFDSAFSVIWTAKLKLAKKQGQPGSGNIDIVALAFQWVSGNWLSDFYLQWHRVKVILFVLWLDFFFFRMNWLSLMLLSYIFFVEKCQSPEIGLTAFLLNFTIQMDVIEGTQILLIFFKHFKKWD